MSILNVCRKSVDRAGRHAPRASWGCLVACLMSLIVSVALCRIETASAADPTPQAAADDDDSILRGRRLRRGKI